MSEFKTCSKCGETKSVGEFGKKGRWCKKCQSEYLKQYRENNKEELNRKAKQYRENIKKQEKIIVETKVCYKCKIEKNVDEFYNDISRIDGFSNSCKKCCNDRDKRYYHKNSQHLKDYQKKYNKENKEKVSIRKKLYYQANEEKIKQYQQLYREENKEELKEYFQQYNKENSEKIIEKAKKWAKEHPEERKFISRKYAHTRRDREKNATGETLTGKQLKLIKEVFENKCFCCQSTENLHYDHVYTLSKHNIALTWGNVAIICGNCNSKKGAKDPEKFYGEEGLEKIQRLNQMAEEIYNEQYEESVSVA